MNRKRIPGAAAVLLWAVLLIPFFAGSFGAHPATDDFTFAIYTHPTWLQTGSILHVLKDAVSYALRTWRDWQGTVTGVIVMCLNPAVFSLEHYGIHAVFLVLLNLTAWLVFLRHMLLTRLKLEKRRFFQLFLSLTLCQMLFLPDIVEGIFWFNGAWFYTGAQAASLLTLTLCDHAAASEKKARVFQTLLACILLFALGMDNYITAMMTAAALFMMALQRGWAFLKTGEAWEKTAALCTALFLIPVGAGLLLSVIAPGNNVRMETDGAHQSGVQWLVMSILWTLRDAVKYILRFSFKTPLMAVLLAVLPGLCREESGKAEETGRVPPVPAILAGTYLILCAMIIPHMYSSGYAGSGRVVNMYHDYVLLAVPLAVILCIKRMKGGKPVQKIASKQGTLAFRIAAVLALVFCLSGGQLGNYLKLAGDQWNGVQRAYTEQFQNEYEICESAGADEEVLLPAWKVQTVTGKPTATEDPGMWTNECMAQYFGVKSIRVVP